jgi:uncharacterized lipoprotein NlpE involved in copper resistance
MKKILSFILIFILFGCNNKNDRELMSKRNVIKKYRFDFPDTLIVNKKYNGILYYESKLDSISSKMGDSENYRYSRLLISKTDIIASTNDEILGNIKDTFWAKNNREIIFTDISFNKEGVFYLEGFIYNIAGVKLNKKDENGEYIYDMIEEYEPVIHKIIVIDKK